jgi:hypothetical protein
MVKTLGIVCTINELGNRLEDRFKETTSYEGITLANPADEKFAWDRTHYLVHLSEIKPEQLTKLCTENPSSKVYAFSGMIKQREACKAYPNTKIYDTAVGAWEACEKEAPVNPY